jgi:hypothetical protein
VQAQTIGTRKAVNKFLAAPLLTYLQKHKIKLVCLANAFSHIIPVQGSRPGQAEGLDEKRLCADLAGRANAEHRQQAV